MFDLKLNIYEYFSPTWSCGRGSETQLQVGENLYKVTYRADGWTKVQKSEKSNFVPS